MGTRCLTLVYDGDDKLPCVVMYRQMDGYPDGHGLDLAEFAAQFDIHNGYNGSESPNRKHANGAGCFAAQMVAHYKDDIGGFYLLPYTPELDHGQDYVYILRVTEKMPVFIAVFESYGEKAQLIACDAQDYAHALAVYTAAQESE